MPQWTFKGKIGRSFLTFGYGKLQQDQQPLGAFGKQDLKACGNRLWHAVKPYTIRQLRRLLKKLKS